MTLRPALPRRPGARRAGLPAQRVRARGRLRGPGGAARSCRTPGAPSPPAPARRTRTGPRAAVRRCVSCRGQRAHPLLGPADLCRRLPGRECHPPGPEEPVLMRRHLPAAQPLPALPDTRRTRLCAPARCTRPGAPPAPRAALQRRAPVSPGPGACACSSAACTAAAPTRWETWSG